MPVHHEDLHLGAEVISSDGRQVGTLEDVLIDEEGMDLRHIVVRESATASGHHWYQGATMLIPDVIVPADAIETATHDRVVLNLTLSQVRHLPPSLSFQYVGITTPSQLAAAMAGAPVYPYRETAAKPDGELEVHPGEKVMFKHSGELLGHVRDLVYDDAELVGVVVRPHEWLSHDVLIQVRFLDRSDDVVLFAHITRDNLRHLPPFVDATTS